MLPAASDTQSRRPLVLAGAVAAVALVVLVVAVMAFADGGGSDGPGSLDESAGSALGSVFLLRRRLARTAWTAGRRAGIQTVCSDFPPGCAPSCSTWTAC
jgi:hypothetical protein